MTLNEYCDSIEKAFAAFGVHGFAAHKMPVERVVALMLERKALRSAAKKSVVSLCIAHDNHCHECDEELNTLEDALALGDADDGN